MPVSLTVVKRLFAKSGNQCAIPWCHAPLVVEDHSIAEICHIRARRKGGPRYDSELTAAEKDDFKNLILLCPTHHTEVDKSPVKYSVDILTEIKEMHERESQKEITPRMAEQAALIHAKQSKKTTNSIKSSPVHGNADARAASGGVAVAIGGHNQGKINIHVGGKPKKETGRYPANSIGADANLSGYVDYLCDLYVKFMSPIERDEAALWGKIGKHIKTKFRLVKRSRGHIPAEKFPKLVEFLVYEKLAKTPVGQKHVRNGMRLCSTFQEWREGK